MGRCRTHRLGLDLHFAGDGIDCLRPRARGSGVLNFMATLIVSFAVLVIAVVVGLRFRRRWVEPWLEIEELVKSIISGGVPRKFLITANERGNAIGLALEQFA